MASTNWTMTIGGSAVNVIQGSLDVQNQIGQRSTGSVQIWTNRGVSYKYGTQCSVFDQTGKLRFSGFTAKDKVTKGTRQGQGFLEHTITLMDNVYLADKRYFFGSFLNTPAGIVVQTLLAQVLKFEGVVMTATSIALGPTIPEIIWNGKQVSQAITWLAQISGYWWNIDLNKVLWFQPYAGIAAPFVLDGTQVSVDGSLSVTFGNDLYVNKQTVKGGTAQTGVITESQHGDGAKRNFTLPYAIASTAARDLTIKVNGTAQSYGTKGQTGQQWYVAVGDAVCAQDSSGTILGSGDTLAVTYKGRFPIRAVAQNTALQIQQQTREGGGTSGIVESVYTDNKIHSQGAAFQIAGGLLAHYTADMTQLEFATLTDGLMEGQMLNVNLPDFGLNSAQMLIRGVELTNSINDQFNIWQFVTAVGSPYEGAQWQTYWANLMNQQLDPSELSDVDDTTVAFLFASSVFLSFPTMVGSTARPGLPFPLPPNASLGLPSGSGQVPIVAVHATYSTCPICNTSTLCNTSLIVC